MIRNIAYGALFSLLLAGCAGEPVRVHLPATHPADHRAQEPEFWGIPNPFAGTPEGAADSPADKPDESAPSQHHGHPSTGPDHSQPEGGKSGEGGEQPHHMQHGQ
jgi:hypothetical protein